MRSFDDDDDVDPAARAAQTARYRAMTPSERLQEAIRMYWDARELRAAYLRQRHPDWSEEAVQAAVREAFMYASD